MIMIKSFAGILTQLTYICVPNKSSSLQLSLTLSVLCSCVINLNGCVNNRYCPFFILLLIILSHRKPHILTDPLTRYDKRITITVRSGGQCQSHSVNQYRLGSPHKGFFFLFSSVLLNYYSRLSFTVVSLNCSVQ